MKCEVCGRVNEVTAAYCRDCGTALPPPTQRFVPTVSDADVDAATDIEADSSEHGRVLLVRNGPLKGSRLTLNRAEVEIGRDPACDVFLDDVTVSRHHAVIRAGLRSDTIEDNNSLNGTYVNGSRVESSSLRSGDTVQIGRYRLVYLRPSSRRAPPKP
jgi:pSer/pThr/pTyr-binding forkhead associated (FHA) protein